MMLRAHYAGGNVYGLFVSLQRPAHAYTDIDQHECDASNRRICLARNELKIGV